jgi:hypothetical protein
MTELVMTARWDGATPQQIAQVEAKLADLLAQHGVTAEDVAQLEFDLEGDDVSGRTYPHVGDALTPHNDAWITSPPSARERAASAVMHAAEDVALRVVTGRDVLTPEDGAIDLVLDYRRAG